MKKSASDYLESDNSLLLIGAIAGGLLGAGAAAFLSSEKGQEWCEDLSCACQNLSDKVSDKACGLKENIRNRKEDFIDKIQGWGGTTRCRRSHPNLFLGGAAGGLLSAAALYLLCQKYGICSTSDKEETWMNRAKSMLQKVQNALENECEECQEQTDNSKETGLNNIIDLAHFGVRLFNLVKQRR